MSRKFQGFFKKVSRVFQVRLNGVLSYIKGGSWVEINLKGLSGKFQCCFDAVSKVFQGCFKGVSRKIGGCFKGDFSEFQGYLKEVQRYFQILSKKFQ